MPTPSPTMAPMVGAAVETVRPPASSTMPPSPTPTATSASTIGTRAATTVPKATRRTTSAARRPTASAGEDFFSALRNAASPPNSACRPPARAGSRASPTSAAVARPNSVDGTSSAISAKAIRPSAETRPVSNGSLTAGDVVDLRDLRERRLDARAVAGHLLALGSGEHGDRAAAGFRGEALLEQVHRLGALAARCAEVVGERSADGAGQDRHERGEDRPRADRRPRPACAEVADAADEAVHGVLLSRVGCNVDDRDQRQRRGRGPSGAGRAARPGRRPGRAGPWCRRSRG